MESLRPEVATGDRSGEPALSEAKGNLQLPLREQTHFYFRVGDERSGTLDPNTHSPNEVGLSSV